MMAKACMTALLSDPWRCLSFEAHLIYAPILKRLNAKQALIGVNAAHMLILTPTSSPYLGSTIALLNLQKSSWASLISFVPISASSNYITLPTFYSNFASIAIAPPPNGLGVRASSSLFPPPVVVESSKASDSSFSRARSCFFYSASLFASSSAALRSSSISLFTFYCLPISVTSPFSFVVILIQIYSTFSSHFK